MSFEDIDKMSTSNLRAELKKRGIDCSESSRKILIKKLKESIENAIAVKCYSGTKCETGCLYWDIEWNAVECISAIGPGHSIKSTYIKVGDFDWYAELFPKGELQKNHLLLQQNQNHNNNNNISTSNTDNNPTGNNGTNIINDNDNNIANNNSNNSNNNNNNTSSTRNVAPALFLSICNTKKPVQMRFTVQLYHGRTQRWSDPVISSLRVFLRNNHGWGWKEWMDFHDLQRDYASDGKLKLKITIDVYGPVNTQILNDKVTFNIQSQLSSKMSELFNSGKHSDVTVVVSGYTLYPNKCKSLLSKQTNNASISGTGTGSMAGYGGLDSNDEEEEELCDFDDDLEEEDEIDCNAKKSKLKLRSNNGRKRKLGDIEDEDEDEDVENENENENKNDNHDIDSNLQRRHSYHVNNNHNNGYQSNLYKRRKLNGGHGHGFGSNSNSGSPRRERALSMDNVGSNSATSGHYDCIDLVDNNHNHNFLNNHSMHSSSSQHLIRNNNNKTSTIEKLSVLGIDEDLRDKNGRTFVTFEIRAHRCILANMSSYFERMFSHQFKENVDGKIYIGNGNGNGNDKETTDNDEDMNMINNVDPYIMKVLLEYIYTEQIENGIDRYLLLLLADRYQIERLVMICLQDLTNEMNINNVTTILSISNKFNEKYSCAHKVKLMCLEFICKNISFVMETSSYKHACKNDKSLTQEILTAFANKHKKSRHHNLMSPQRRRFS